MEALTVKELREMAKAKKVKGYSKMKKAELISSLKKLKNDMGNSKNQSLKEEWERQNGLSFLTLWMQADIYVALV